MDATLLTTEKFWRNATPFATSEFPGEIPWIPELSGHVLFETSGSTGTPKWVVLSRRALLISANAVNHHLGVTSASCWGLALPLHHVGGFGVAARSYSAGCRIEIMGQRWNACDYKNWVSAHGVSHSSLVPTQVHDLVAAQLAAPESLRAIVIGGGHLDAATGQAARDLGWPVLASYGMTETASQIATQSLEMLALPYQPAPIPLLPIWETSVTSDETLQTAGAALFSGIMVHENHQWEFQPRVSKWYHTQDRAMIQSDGITLLGRADSFVKILGELVNPESIEQEFIERSGHQLAPGMCVVVAIPDARAGNLLVPVFDAAVGGDLVAFTLANYAKQAVGFRRTQPPIMLDDFPRSALGKPLRKEILRRALEIARHPVVSKFV